MPSQSFAIPTLEQLLNKILTTRCISRMDQAWLMTLLNKQEIQPQENDLVNQVFQSLQQGRLRVI